MPWKTEKQRILHTSTDERALAGLEGQVRAFRLVCAEAELVGAEAADACLAMARQAPLLGLPIVAGGELTERRPGI